MFFSTMSEKSITICLYADENNPERTQEREKTCDSWRDGVGASLPAGGGSGLS